jgi:hypothetical protein
MAPMLSRCPSPDRCRSASRKVYARAVNAMWRCSPGYEVRRVGRDECCGLAVPYAMHVGDVRAVAAEQAVVAEDPQVARLATETAGGGSAPESLFLRCTRSWRPAKSRRMDRCPTPFPSSAQSGIPPSWVRLR